jgi:hypothetical protein
MSAIQSVKNEKLSLKQRAKLMERGEALVDEVMERGEALVDEVIGFKPHPALAAFKPHPALAAMAVAAMAVADEADEADEVLSPEELAARVASILESQKEDRARIEALERLVAERPVEPSAKPSAKPRAKNPDAPKRAPSAYIVFSSQRVGPVVRKAEEGQEKKTPVGVINQFAGQLWGKKHEWEDDEILAAWPEFTPPEVSKQALKKSETGSVEKKTGKGSRGPQSDEVKAAAKLKRDANKAKKAAAEAESKAESKADAESEAESEAEASESEAVPEPPAVAPPVVPTVKVTVKPKTDVKATTVKPATAAVPAPKPATNPKSVKAPKKVIDLLLDEWEHEGITYYKNERNDVLSLENEWVGRWNGKEIDESVLEPADFLSLTTRDL